MKVYIAALAFLISDFGGFGGGDFGDLGGFSGGFGAFGGGPQTAPTMRPGDPTQADVALVVSSIPRFTPDRFAALPPTVREAFTAMNCQVPQPTLTGGPQNLVQGELAAKGQRDWAALCSDGTTTQIRVVWGGPVRCEDSFAPLQDSDLVRVTAPGIGTYTRVLSVASIEQIGRHLLRLRATLPEPPSHDAIEDGPETARRVHYCRGGHWMLVH
jgi:hypothetical protein